MSFAQAHSTTTARSRVLTPKVCIINVVLRHFLISFAAQSLALDRYNALVSSLGELTISGSDDHTLFLWSLFPSRTAPGSASVSEASERGGKLKPLARLTGHQRQVSHVTFSPDGRWAASAAWDSSVRIWDGRTGKFVATLRGHVGAVYRLAWSADSRMLVSASKDSTLKVSVDNAFQLYVI